MEDWESELEALILEKGEALGVNAISEALGVPLTTMQRRLEKSKFVKTPQRKWDLPEKAAVVASNTDGYTEALEAHIKALEGYMDIMSTTLGATAGLIRIHKALPTSVAAIPSMSTNNTPKLDKRLEDVLENIRLLPKMIKEHINKFPEEYHDMLGNMDYMDAFIQIGRVGLNTLMNELNEIILEDREFLSDEALTMLKRYQKSK